MRIGDRIIHDGRLAIVLDIREPMIDVRYVRPDGSMDSPLAVLVVDVAPLGRARVTEEMLK